MNALTRFSLKNAAAVILVAVLITAGGAWSAMQLKKETMPDIAIPVVVVTTVYPGAAPSDVYDNVTKPLEKAMRGTEGVQRVSAQSGDSFSVVVAEFSFSQDMEKAEQSVAKVIAPVKLPDNAIEPKISRIGFNSAPIVMLAVTSESKDAGALRADVRDRVIPALQGVTGVGEAKLAADSPAQIRIVLDPEKLKDEGLTADGVIQQLQAANLSFPIGAVDLGTTTEPIRVGGTVDSVKAIREFQIAKYPNQGELMGEAFAEIGKGMGQLGSAVGALGQGMGQGFAGLGAGLGQVGAATGQIGMQAGLINGIQQLQAQMYSLKYDTLPSMKAAASSMPTDTPEYAQLTEQINAIETQTLPGMQAAINDMQKQITASQKQLMAQQQAAAAAGGGSSAGLSMPAGGGSMKSSSGGGSTALEPEIKVVELGDVAVVTYGPPPGTVGSRANGKQAALIDIVKTSDANTVDVSEGIKELLPTLEEGLPEGAKFITVYDASKGINASIEGMVREGALGALFAVIVILIFLRNWRATLIAAISIPLSIVTAMVLLKQIGVTLNVMTLGGLTVAIGRVVDDSIVVIENIFRHLQRGDARTSETIRVAAKEVTGAITSSTLTTVAVFLPLGLVTGVIGKIFLPFALTVALSLLASLLVAVTIVPLMAKWMLLKAKVPAEHKDGRIMLSYQKALAWSLDHRWVIVSSAAVLFVASLALIPIIGTGFVPESKEKYITVEVTYPEGTKSTEVDKTAKVIEGYLTTDKNVELYESTIGGTNDFSMGGASGGANKATMMVRLAPDASSEALIDGLRKKTAALEVNGAQIVYSRVDASGTNSELEVIVTGDSLAEIRQASDIIEAKMKSMKGLENVKSNLGESRKQLTVDVKQDEAAYYGMNAAMVAGTVRGFVAEQKAGTVKVDGENTDVVYALKLDDIKKAEELRKLELSTPLGDTIQLKKIANVEETGSPVAVLTRDGTQYASVSGRITERDSGSVISAVKTEVAALKLPAGVETEIGGAAEQMSESFQQLGIAMIIAIGAVYLVMIIAFGEATAPLAIMMSLPLAVVGGLIGLLIAGVPLDIPAMIGALMLIGIVVTNAIVLVDRVLQIQCRGLSRREALMEAGSTRMRPILMTAVATVMALAPLASGFAEGALISQGLAVIVIGGLTTSTMLTLIVVPVAYDLLEGMKERIFGKGHGEEDEVLADGSSAEEPVTA